MEIFFSFQKIPRFWASKRRSKEERTDPGGYLYSLQESQLSCKALNFGGRWIFFCFLCNTMWSSELLTANWFSQFESSHGDRRIFECSGYIVVVDFEQSNREATKIALISVLILVVLNRNCRLRVSWLCLKWSRNSTRLPVARCWLIIIPCEFSPVKSARLVCRFQSNNKI